MSFIELNDVAKYWGDVKAVEKFNLEIEEGDFVVLLGPSGCGKSTTLRLIAGLEKVSSGEIIIDGQNVNDLDPSLRNISMVFQSYALFPHLSVKENIIFGLKVRKVDKEERERFNRGVFFYEKIRKHHVVCKCFFYYLRSYISKSNISGTRNLWYCRSKFGIFR